MSYGASVALQTAVYEVLRGSAELNAVVGDAIYDSMPVAAPAGAYVSIGTEEVRDAGDITGAGSSHDFVVSVLSGTDDAAGFGAIKQAAVAVSDALDGQPLTLRRGHLVGLWFQRARARRVENGAGRRIDLTFRARIDLA
ncbi:DUF3168 domain-containing protein [Paracoccus sp. DMF-8]|uniref:DUF3168 domain-containing protein n=1 Tax=Paracoccus sp. DMF-8 TaxID=3019445 RepID=UPI0023E75694|nr:DUF3168 domain-containing protein [Paracoccus sp. DMF-8]MDF3605694.1 DUF3168 domain-containing protein [Paracoccus sp. DMF-8]